MKGINTPLLIILSGLLSGIITGSYFEFPATYLLLSATSALVLTFILHLYLSQKQKNSALSGLSVFFLFFIIGMGLLSASNPLNAKNHYTHLISSKEESNLILSIDEALNPGYYDSKFIAKVIQVEDEVASGKILITIKSDSTRPQKRLEVGDRIYTKSTIQDQVKLNYPYQFDYGKYLATQTVYAQLKIAPAHYFILDKSKPSIRHDAASIKTFLKTRLLNYNFDPDSRAILNALLLGERQDLSSELKSSYADAGIIHILAVSGLHVGILMLIVQFLLKPLGNYRRARILRLFITLFVIWAFAVLTGLSPSVLRAATMFSFLQVGLLLGQRQAGINALIASALVLLLCKPRLLFEVGFQLSYAAVFFILWLYPKIEALLKPKNKLLKYYWQLIAVSLAAQLGVLPLSLFYFHQFPGLFLVANIIIVPALAVLLVYGILILVLAALNLLPTPVAWVYDELLQFLNAFIRYLSSFDFLIFKGIYFPFLLLVAGYFIVLSFGKLLGDFSIKNTRFVLVGLAIFPLCLIVLKVNQHPAFFVLNQHRSSSMLLLDAQNNLKIYQSAPTQNTAQILRTAQENLQLKSVSTDTLKNTYSFSSKRLLVVDSLGVYNIKGFNPSHILLCQSPKINLDRLLNLFPDASIIADASNYKSYIMRWKATCKKQKIPFHSTYEKGFYKMD